MARKSKFYLPNPSTGVKEEHHLETELAQICDLSQFVKSALSSQDAATFLNRIGAEAKGASSAAAHNGIYRGKDLTSYFNSGGMSAAIANGTFDDIPIKAVRPRRRKLRRLPASSGSLLPLTRIFIAAIRKPRLTMSCSFLQAPCREMCR